MKALSKALEELKKTGKARLRLSGRDDKTFWAMVIKGRLAELRENPKANELLNGKCMDFYTAKMTDRMTE